MNHESEYSGWPQEAGEPSDLPSEMAPTPGLEDRIVALLQRRDLLRPGQQRAVARSGGSVLRAGLLAASVATVAALAFWAGRASQGESSRRSSAVAGGSIYALLLYETDSYDPASDAALRARYDEYSYWVAEARQRGQFVDGQDLEVESGWMLRPEGEGSTAVAPTALPGAAPLSGIFFIRGDDSDEVLDLAASLPHRRHGGHVLVQKVIPTDEPPASPRR